MERGKLGFEERNEMKTPDSNLLILLFLLCAVAGSSLGIALGTLFLRFVK